MILPDHVPQQPTFAFLEFLVAGENIIYTPEDGPKRLISFTYHRTTETTFNTFEVVLFDPDWYIVEDLLAANYNRILFRYGYYDPNGNMLTEWAAGFVNSVVPQIVIDGTILNVVGNSQIWIRDPQQSDERRFKKWGGIDNPIDEIVKEITKWNEWMLIDYLPTEEMRNFDDLYDSMPIPKYYHQEGMGDFAFIKHNLIPYACTDTGMVDDAGDKIYVGGYRAWFNDHMTAALQRPSLYFLPYDYKVRNVTREYRYMRGHQGLGEVIQWNPDLSHHWRQKFGSMDMKTSGYGQYDKDLMTYYARTKVSKENIGQRVAKDHHQVLVAGPIASGNDNNYIVAPNRDIRWVQGLYRRDMQIGGQIGAEMVIAGDPFREVHEQVRVICLCRDGTVHYSSGIYEILAITDTVSNAGFTSTFKLMKVANLDGVLVSKRFGEYLEGM